MTTQEREKALVIGSRWMHNKTGESYVVESFPTCEASLCAGVVCRSETTGELWFCKRFILLGSTIGPSGTLDRFTHLEGPASNQPTGVVAAVIADLCNLDRLKAERSGKDPALVFYEQTLEMVVNLRRKIEESRIVAGNPPV